MQPTVLIIGGTSGLGRSLCALYAGEGCKVGVVGRRKNLLDELKAKFPQQIFTLQHDISSTETATVISDFIESLNGVDIIIITASVVSFNNALSHSIEKETIATNVNGYVSVINAAYHYFSQKKGGHIVAVTSIAAARGNKGAPAYNASKAFQSSYLEGIRLKLLQEQKNVSVTELIPGYMDTQMAKGERLFWVAALNEAARQAKAAIEKKKQRTFITRRWRLIYYVYKYLPSSLYYYLINSNIKLDKRS